MNQFSTYFTLGLEHISDLQGYDHILFIVTLCAAYSITEWKKVAILVTAFTLGHSLTLSLSAYRVLLFNSQIIEILIPVTILLTCLINIILQPSSSGTIGYKYLMALTFGFIHGMGFSNFFNSLFDADSNILLPLFAFNIGIEVGQLVIIFTFFAIYFGLNKIVNIEQRSWKLFLSFGGSIISLMLIVDRINQM